MDENRAYRRSYKSYDLLNSLIVTVDFRTRLHTVRGAKEQSMAREEGDGAEECSGVSIRRGSTAVTTSATSVSRKSNTSTKSMSPYLKKYNEEKRSPTQEAYLKRDISERQL